MRLYRDLLLCLSLVVGCASVPRAPRPEAPKWTPVKGGVELVVNDPSRDALFVRARGRSSAISATAKAGQTELLAIPSLDNVPSGALARVTALRGLRWLDVHQPLARWQSGAVPEDAFGSVRLGLPPYAIVAGVVVETPLMGPFAGLPRPVMLLGRMASPATSSTSSEPTWFPDDTLVDGRDGTLIAVAAGRAFRLDTAAGEARELPLNGATALEVRPAVGPGGQVFAVALSMPMPATEERPAHTAYGVMVSLPDGRQTLLPTTRPPVSLHLAASAVWAVVEEAGDRRLYRFDVRPWPKARLTARETALLEHRAGLLVGIREHLNEKRLARAVDWVDLLRFDGLLDAPTAAEGVLVQEVVDRARPVLETAARDAFFGGVPERAWVFDQRAVLLDGRRVLPQDVMPPSLRLRLQTEGAGISSQQVASFFETRPGFVARQEACEPGATVACLEVTLRAPHLDLAQANARVDASLRDTASEYLRLRLDCADDGKVLFDETAAGPRAVFSCDLEHRVRPVASHFAELLLARQRLARAPVRVAEMTYADGDSETLELPASLSPADALEDAVDLALQRQTQRHLQAARTTGDVRRAEVDALRTLLWRGERANEEVRGAAMGNGELRRSWLGVAFEAPVVPSQPAPAASPDDETAPGSEASLVDDVVNP